MQCVLRSRQPDLTLQLGAEPLSLQRDRIQKEAEVRTGAGARYRARVGELTKGNHKSKNSELQVVVVLVDYRIPSFRKPAFSKLRQRL